MQNKQRKLNRAWFTKRLKGRIQSAIRHNRRESLIKLIAKKNKGVVPCFVCGLHVGAEQASLEHILPKSLGGTDEMDNLWISHAICNQKRGSDLDYPCMGIPAGLSINKAQEAKSRSLTKHRKFSDERVNLPA